jgi:hypothetical protein
MLKSAAEKLSDNGVVNYHLGMAYKDLGQKDLAVASLEKALALVPAEGSGQRAKIRAALDELGSRGGRPEPVN